MNLWTQYCRHQARTDYQRAYAVQKLLWCRALKRHDC